MNAYLLSSMQSAACGNQFECPIRDADSDEIIFSSMRHRNEVGVADEGDALLVVSILNNEGLKAKFAELATIDGLVIRHKHNDLTDQSVLLGQIFAAAAELLPNEVAVVPERTESQSVVKMRLGQHATKPRSWPRGAKRAQLRGFPRPRSSGPHTPSQARARTGIKGSETGRRGVEMSKSRYQLE